MKIGKFLKGGISALVKPVEAFERPLHLQVEPTSRCNLNCYFCSRLKSVLDGKGIDMDLDNFKRLLGDVRPIRVTFAGRGEPLMNKNIIRMIELVKGAGAKSIITTNFTVGERYAKELVSSGHDILRISIDAATPEVYEKIRGRDYFEKIVSGIKLINEAKKTTGSVLPSVGFEFVMTQDNIHQVEELVDLSASLKIDKINFRALGLVGIEDKVQELMGRANKEKFRELLVRANKKSDTLGIKTNLPTLVKDLDFYWNRYSKSKPSKVMGCLYLWLQLFVSAEGEVAPCCALFMDEGVSMGNVFKEGFDSVWNGERFKEFRHQMKAGESPYNSCQVCIPKSMSWIYKKIKLIRS